jgi:pimeloyl-ACP methyl ester carboxylesterase
VTALAAADLEVERLGAGTPVLFVHGSVVGPELTWRRQRPLAARWSLILPSRPGFGASPPLPRNDFEAEAPLFSELLGDGAHLVGHSYGAVIALLAAAQRPQAVLSLTLSEPGTLQLAGTPAGEEMISRGERLYAAAGSIAPEAFLRLFRHGANSARETPSELPEALRRGAELAMRERPPWEGEVPLARLAEAGIPALVVSGGHSPVFEAVCDRLAAGLGAERATVEGRGHSVPETGAPYNELLERFLRSSERSRRGPAQEER